MEAIRNANTFACGTDFDYYQTHDAFTKIMNEESSEVMRSINNILKIYDIHDNIKNRGLEEKTELIVEANDVILENVANNIDEMNGNLFVFLLDSYLTQIVGIKKNPQEAVVLQEVSVQLPVNGSWNRIARASFSVASVSTIVSSLDNFETSILIDL